MATVATLALSLGASTAQAASPTAYVYATSRSQVVNQFSTDDTGALTALQPPSAAAGSTSTQVAASPDGRSLYVVNQSTGDVSQYDIALDGTLTPKTPATVASGQSPFGIAVAPDGGHVYVANRGGGTISVFAVGSDGALTLASTASAGAAPTEIAVSRDGASAYVTNFSDGTVGQYDVGADGALMPKAAPTMAAGPSPEGIALSPDGASVYVTNQIASGTVTQFSVGAGGALAPKAAGPVAAGSLPAGIVATPGGVYVSDYGSNAISQYRADGNGALSASGAAVAGPRGPYGLAVSPDRHSLYVAAFGDAGVGQYDIGADGTLTAMSPTMVAAGFRPTGVAAVTPRDETAPTVDLRTPADGATYTVGDDVTADYSCDDAGPSGLASCTGDVASGAPIDTSTAGTHTFTVTARDNAGNETTVTHSYEVEGGLLGFLGFLSPTAGSPVRAGTTVPVVFDLGGDRGPDVLAAGSPTSSRVDCWDTSTPTGGDPTAGALSYDATTGHYVYLWQTDRAWANTCRAFVLTLSDGTVHSLVVKLRPKHWYW